LYEKLYVKFNTCSQAYILLDSLEEDMSLGGEGYRERSSNMTCIWEVKALYISSRESGYPVVSSYNKSQRDALFLSFIW